MELYRDGATLYKRTPTETADLFLPSSLHTSREALRPSHVPFKLDCFGLFGNDFDKDGVQTEPKSSLISLRQLLLILWVVCSEASKAGVSVSPEHHAKFYLTTILHSALYTFTAHRKILCSVCISDKTQ